MSRGMKTNSAKLRFCSSNSLMMTPLQTQSIHICVMIGCSATLSLDFDTNGLHGSNFYLIFGTYIDVSNRSKLINGTDNMHDEALVEVYVVSLKAAIKSPQSSSKPASHLIRGQNHDVMVAP
jgi:hypothetical protein